MATILVVEDHALSRQVLKTLLGYMGHRVLEAADGSTALALARAEQPDLIISDIVMPTMDGLQFIRLLRAEKGLKAVPVIFYTAAYRLPEAMLLAKEMGEYRVISKPSDPTVILQTVQETLGLPSPEIPSPPAADREHPGLVKPDFLQRAGLQLATLMDLSFHLVGQRDPARLLEIFSRACREMLNCRGTFLEITASDGRKSCFLGQERNGATSACQVNPFLWKEISAFVTEKRLPFRWPKEKNGGADAISPRFSFSSQSIMALPFATTESVYGWLCFVDKNDASLFGVEDEEMGVALSAQTALAYENILLIEELRRYTAELETKNKELEAFSYSVAHDLRGPLRRIDSFSRILLKDHAEKLDDKGREYLQRIRATMAQMAQLIDDLLNLAQLSRKELQQEPVNLSALAKEITAKLKVTDPGRTTEFVITEGLAAIGDKKLLQVVLDNLLGNAWKFTGKTRGGKIVFGMMEQEGKPVYFVRDSGAGFDMAYASKLFRPFERMHGVEEFPGTGIGLATVQRIVNRHGGRVWIEGEINKGATVYFTFTL